jgi:hypothetical protein
LNKHIVQARHTVDRLYRKYQNYLKLSLALSLVVMANAVAMAQTATPTEITIPTGDMITYLNEWIEIFGPIVLFVGMIPVALGLLRYVTGLFRSAFGGG